MNRGDFMLNDRINIRKKIEKARPAVPEGMWVKCSKCGKMLYKKELIENNYECPVCHEYFRMPSYDRIYSILDKNSFKEMFTDISECNPIDFPGYSEKMFKIRNSTEPHEAVVVGSGKIENNDIMIGAFDTRFMMGSMGYVVGEKISKLFEYALQEKLPVIIFSCSGGARMQEGIVSLMQMAKTAAAVKKHSDAGLLYISVLTDPTTGGVAASFSMLGDIIIAEPNALVGFAGPRVIEQTIGQKLPNEFQRSEFLLEHGLIDVIVERKNLKLYLERILKLHQKHELKLTHHINESEKSSVTKSDSWTKVLLSRQADRPTSLEYIEHIFDDFVEFHGDHETGEDSAIIGGIASLAGLPVTVIGHQKGKNTEENVKRNFAMAHPEGYREAMRLMREAEKFGRPIITFVDTPGAACGIEAEERGEATAIANNLFEMSTIKVPILSILIGEGGSGGALGIAVANEVWALENATYSVLSPEGFASILWKDGTRAKEASLVMKMTAEELLGLGVIEKIIPEAKVATRDDFREIATDLREGIILFIDKMNHKNFKEIVDMRYERFRAF